MTDSQKIRYEAIMELESVRKASGMSKAELYRRSGKLSKQIYSEYIKGKSFPSHNTLCKISHALNRVPIILIKQKEYSE